jgi:glycosyltransferase involved in cell wall biosynthesis
MNIIQTTSALAPEFGGPVRSVPALSRELAELGHQVTLVYLDFGGQYKSINLPIHPRLDYQVLPVKLWVGMRPLWIPSYRSTIEKLISKKDDLLFHDNGVWLPYSGLILDLAQHNSSPVITSTRGMLEPWAMDYGRLRKKAAWHLYQKGRLEKNNVLHATSRAEAGHLRDLGLRVPIAVIPNGTVIPQLSNYKRTDKNRKKTLLFLSRIHPKKGLLNLVKAMAVIQPASWEITIAGYDEAGHQKVVEDAARKSGVEAYFNFIGPVDDAHKWEVYQAADVFILPSYSENFGMVIAEALASGKPVITTTGTPWKDLIDYNCGWWIDPTLEDLISCLTDVFSREDQLLIEMGNNGRELVTKKYSWPVIAKELSEVYSWMLGKRKNLPNSIT